MHRAFTLIELLVVITIIVILLALLAPALDKAISEAEAAVCGANLRNVAQAVHLYALDEKRSIPDPMRFSVLRPKDTFNNNAFNPHSFHLDKKGRMGIKPDPEDPETYPGGQLWAYVPSEATFQCPTFSGQTPPPDHYEGSDPLGYRHDPIEQKMGSAFVMHRGFGGHYHQNLTLRKIDGPWHNRAGGPQGVLTSSQLMLTEESLYSYAYAGTPRNDTAIAMNRDPTNPFFRDGLANYHPTVPGARSPEEGSASVGFVDGHVERVAPSQAPGIAYAGWSFP